MFYFRYRDGIAINQTITGSGSATENNENSNRNTELVANSKGNNGKMASTNKNCANLNIKSEINLGTSLISSNISPSSSTLSNSFSSVSSASSSSASSPSLNSFTNSPKVVSVSAISNRENFAKHEQGKMEQQQQQQPETKKASSSMLLSVPIDDTEDELDDE